MLEDYQEIVLQSNHAKMAEEVRKIKEEKPDPFWKRDFKAELENTLSQFNWYKTKTK